jgi:hypothetical protein
MDSLVCGKFAEQDDQKCFLELAEKSRVYSTKTWRDSHPNQLIVVSISKMKMTWC